MRSGFISMSVHSFCVKRLQFVPLWLTSTESHIMTSLYEKLSQLS